MDKMICVGKNYLEHAKELGDAVPEQPVLFLKPPSVLLEMKPTATSSHEPLTVLLPSDRGEVHHECEIVLKLSSSGQVEAVTLGLDLTLRNQQAELKKKGLPWEVSKVFRNSAVVGPWVPITKFPNYLNVEFSFSLDGVVRQKACGSEMRFSVERCVDYARKCFPICAGDLLFTGTPAGVGPLHNGQIGVLQWGSVASGGEMLKYEVRFV